MDYLNIYLKLAVLLLGLCYCVCHHDDDTVESQVDNIVSQLLQSVGRDCSGVDLEGFKANLRQYYGCLSHYPGEPEVPNEPLLQTFCRMQGARRACNVKEWDFPCFTAKESFFRHLPEIQNQIMYNRCCLEKDGADFCKPFAEFQQLNSLCVSDDATRQCFNKVQELQENESAFETVSGRCRYYISNYECILANNTAPEEKCKSFRDFNSAVYEQTRQDLGCSTSSASSIPTSVFQWTVLLCCLLLFRVGAIHF